MEAERIAGSTLLRMKLLKGKARPAPTDARCDAYDELVVDSVILIAI